MPKARKPAAPHDGEPLLEPTLWVDRYGDYLLRYAVCKVAGRGEAEDLVQEALLAAWRGRAKFRGLASERSWLTAILKRKIIDHLRRAVRESSIRTKLPEDRAIDQRFTASGRWKRSPGSWTGDEPTTVLERKEFRDALESCTAKLPGRLRDAFILWHLQEEPTDSVCRSLKMTPGNLWTTLHRARMRLWACLGHTWYEVETDGSAKKGRR